MDNTWSAKLVISCTFHSVEKYNELMDKTKDVHWMNLKRKAFNYDEKRYRDEGCKFWVDDIDTIRDIKETEDGYTSFEYQADGTDWMQYVEVFETVDEVNQTLRNVREKAYLELYEDDCYEELKKD